MKLIKAKAGILLTRLQSGRFSTFLVLVSLTFNLCVAVFVNKGYIGPDGRSYQRMAYNISEGNGYSNNLEPPFERQFFREPVYPYFFSLASVINKTIGNSNEPLAYKAEKAGFYEGEHKEIIILRIMQALLSSITLLLFHKIILSFLSPSKAMLISSLFVFYFPFAVFITFPQRELLATTLLMGMGLLYLRSARSPRPAGYDILFGILAVLLVLTLQVYFYILPVFLICHLALTKDWRRSLRSALAIGGIFILGVAPWSVRGVLEAGSIKAIKTFGVSYTYEFKKFHDANARAYFENLNGMQDFFIDQIVEGYSEPGKIMFEKSFNGYYLKYADSLKNIVKENRSSKGSDRIRILVKSHISKFRKALVWPMWKPDYRQNISSLLKSESGEMMIIMLSVGVLIAILFSIGLILFISKTWYFLPVFIFHLLTIPLLADEGRRVLPFIPFYFMFFILGSLYIFSPQKRDDILINGKKLRLNE